MASKIYEIIRRNNNIARTEGDYGVEIEMEGENFPLVRDWRGEQDHSLRGNSIEYVMNQPLKKQAALLAITNLYKTLDNSGARIKETYRAGVHVHMNVQDFTINELFNFITLYLIMEKPLINFCGEDRVGNHFCLRACDADYIIDMITESLSTRNLKRLNNMDIRYASINLSSLFKYGSVEFRAMRSCATAGPILDWIKILDRIKKSSREYESPMDLMAAFSMKGPNAFAKEVFGDKMNKVCDYDGVTADIIEGMRIAQDVAFGLDWSSLDKKVVEGNPFKKNMGKGNNEGKDF